MFAHAKELDEQRIVDYAADGSVVGIEFLELSAGVDLHDLPFHDELARLFAQQRIKTFV